jgi:hypothetical protein
MHYFLNLFDKILYMFGKVLPSIIRSISTLYTQQLVFVKLVLLVVAGAVGMTTPATTNRTSMTNTSCCVYSVEILLMMDGEIFQTCRVFYQINLRNSASHWLLLTL